MASPKILGNVHGGQQPIAGSAVYLFAAGTGSYGGASVSLLNSNVAINNPANFGLDGNENYYVLSDAAGNFSISGDYTCTAGQQIYIYAVGGDPGIGQTNSAAGMLAILGNCPGGTLDPSLYVFVDEVSTIAAAYSFAGFATDATHVSSSGTVLARTGIANAFANAANLAGLSTGAALAAGPNGSVIVPQATINTLANILAACVNSDGPESSACSTIFDNMKSVGGSGTTAMDTATAAIYIAHNPGVSVETLFDLPVPDAPFGPALTTPPNDFALALLFNDPSISNPMGVAIDAAGNVWITNYNSGNGNSVTELNGATGATISPAGVGSFTGGFIGGGLSGPTGIAIDNAGNVWVGNSGSETAGVTVSELNGSTGAPISGAEGYGGGGLHNPQGVSVDAGGYIWIANGANNSVTELYGSNASGGHAVGDPVSGPSGYTGGGINGPGGIAIDNAGFVWVANPFGADVSELNGSVPLDGNPGDALSGSNGYTGGGVNGTTSVAIDASGFVWGGNFGNNTVSQLYGSNAISPILPGDGVSTSSGYTADGSLIGPAGIAIDGAGNVWIANQGALVTELYGSNAVSPNNPGDAISGATGYTAGNNLGGPQGIAIDGSGNVWIADAGGYQAAEFVGAASPVVTPIVANFIAPYSHPASQP